MLNLLWRMFRGAHHSDYDEVPSPFHEKSSEGVSSGTFVIEDDSVLEFADDEVEISFQDGRTAKNDPLSGQLSSDQSDDKYGKSKSLAQQLCEKISGR